MFDSINESSEFAEEPKEDSLKMDYGILALGFLFCTTFCSLCVFGRRIHSQVRIAFKSPYLNGYVLHAEDILK